MYTQKVPKTQKADSTPYTVYDFHGEDVVSLRRDSWSFMDYYQITSIDPANVSLAIRVEKRYKSGRIETVALTKWNVKSTDTDNPLDNNFYKANMALQEMLPLFRESHIIVIERQLHINYKAVRISQHIITFMMVKLFRVPSYPMIFEVDPKLKSKVFNAGRLDAREVKKWAVEKAIELLEARNDTAGLDIMNAIKGKKDDVADTIVQIEALARTIGLPVTPEI